MSARDGHDILYLTPGVFDKGGIARYGRYQIEALRRIVGADRVTVLSMLGHRDDDLETPFHVDWMAGGTGAVNKIALAVRSLATAARRRPSLVWSAHLHFLPIARAAARFAGADYVLNVYGRELWSPYRAPVGWALRTAPHVVSDCFNTAEVLRREKDWRGRTLTVAWDCVDVARFTPGDPDPAVLARYGVRPEAGRLVVLMLGRIARTGAHKGWRRLLDVAARVDPARFRFVLAGDGDMRAELTDEAERRGLADRITFTGSVHEDDLVSIYRLADVFSLVSDCGPGRGEGIPLTPLEAAACGVPILVGNQDGSREAVTDGENGFVLDPSDLDGHAERLGRLLEPEFRQRMGAAARRRIEQNHSFDVFVETHRRVLQQVNGL